MSDKQRIILPEKYYLDYFHYLLNFVERQYAHVLDQPEYLFYQSFRDLTEDAQCLYIRFSNRKGDLFRIGKINYPEIHDIQAARDELRYQEFITINESNDPLQFNLFTKKELCTFYKFLDGNQRKMEMLQELTEEDLNIIHQHEEIAQLQKVQEVEFLKLLFFGNRHTQMTEFVIRDVGNIKLQQLDETKFKPWFQSREEAVGVMQISQLKRVVRDSILMELPIESLLKEMPWKSWLSFSRSKEAAERLLLEIGSYLEKEEKLEEAIQCYNMTSMHPAPERKIRLLEKLGHADEAMSVAEDLLIKSSNASEAIFATDFLNRSGIRINRSMTKLLKSSPTLELEFTDQRVETEVLNHFKSEGWNGLHSENFTWRGLFGLVFWDVLFDETHGAFHHPLQRQPSDLYEKNFYKSRKDLLDERLNSLKTRRHLKKHISKTYLEREGIANRFVTWHDQLVPVLDKIIDRLPLQGLKKVLLEISKQAKENSTGFPDLFIWNEKSYHFYEIKSPNDHLSAQQLFWINFLRSVKIKAEVLRVKYSD